jgi:hypothetical protein
MVWRQLELGAIATASAPAGTPLPASSSYTAAPARSHLDLGLLLHGYVGQLRRGGGGDADAVVGDIGAAAGSGVLDLLRRLVGDGAPVGGCASHIRRRSLVAYPGRTPGMGDPQHELGRRVAVAHAGAEEKPAQCNATRRSVVVPHAGAVNLTH